MRQTLIVGLGLLAIPLAACSSSKAGVADDDVADDDTVGDDDGDDDTSTPPDAPPAAQKVKFLAVGDTGKGNELQTKVGQAMAAVCAEKDCDFVLMLGDNIYQSGPESVDDEQFQTKFEQPYADLNVPFWVVHGNHDYGGTLLFPVGGLGNEFEKGDIEIEYTDHSDKWTMPASHYTFRAGNAAFIGLDTNSIMWSNDSHGDQRAWWPEALAEVEGAEWVFAFGHHPYRSNGTHGDAGNYDAPELFGIPIPNPITELNGTAVKSFFDELVCGNIDVYLCGHDHSRQWIDMPDQLCGAEMLVSGAGAETTELPGQTNTTFFQDATKGGFLYIEIDGNRMTGTFYDENGDVDFERSVTK